MSVRPVPIGESNGPHSPLLDPLGNPLRMHRPGVKGEVRVDVQMGKHGYRVGFDVPWSTKGHSYQTEYK